VQFQELDRRDGVHHAVARHEVVQEGVGRPPGGAPMGSCVFCGLVCADLLFRPEEGVGFGKEAEEASLTMVLLASSFLALALPSSWEAALVRADCPD
jgi:hypothetical protein